MSFGRRSVDRAHRFAPALLTAIACLVAVFLAVRSARAAPDAKGSKGLLLAKRGDCPGAIPILEDAELAHHRPTTALALANCYVATAQLIRASDTYHALADEAPQKFWQRADYNAQKEASRKADDVDMRIPTLRFDGVDKYDELQIDINDKPMADPSRERKVVQDESLRLVVHAKGYKDFKQKVVLAEGERKVIKLKLEKIDAAAVEVEEGDKPTTPPAADKDKKEKPPTSWFGARYRGLIIPQFLMNVAVDGGTNLVVPGGALTFTTAVGDVDVMIAAGYMNYRMSPIAMKGKGAPDTDWEYVESTLQALTASVDLLWTVPLDQNGNVAFRIGGGAGFGWTFTGDLYRVQSYPNNKNLAPADPNTYLPCKGPNNPLGTFKYCNKLDKDADHYPGYVEPNWFQGGKRPLLYPIVVLPELGLTFKPSKGFAIDIETGLSLSGILTGAGIRFAL